MRIESRSFAELTVDEFFGIARLRNEVFYVEQRVDVPDFDDLDRCGATRHWWIPDEEGVAAYARSVRLPRPEHGATASFGRVAVRVDRRGEGLAAALVAAILDAVGAEPVVIHSQSPVMGLYERFGFVPVGDEFIEGGIPHRTMIRPAPEIRVSAVLITDDDGRVLMVRKRGTSRFLNPGGKPEPGEEPAQCAARELAEETGIHIPAGDLIPLGQVREAAANEPGHVVVADIFRAPHPISVLPRPRAEIEEVRFVDPHRVEPDWSPLFTHRIRHLL